VLKIKSKFIFEHAAGETADFGRAQKSPVRADVGGGVNSSKGIGFGTIQVTRPRFFILPSYCINK